MKILFTYLQVIMLLQSNVIVTSHMHLLTSRSVAGACDASYISKMAIRYTTMAESYIQRKAITKITPILSLLFVNKFTLTVG